MLSAKATIDSTLHDAAGSLRNRGANLLFVCLWVLTLLTVTPQEREEEITAVSGLDALALAKLAARFGSLLVLGLIIIQHGGKHSRTSRAVWLLAPLGAYFGFSLLSTAWSPLKTVSVGQLISFCVLCLLAWAVASLGSGEITARRVLAHLNGCLLAFSLIMLLDALAGGKGFDRFAFSLAHPTTVAGSASIGLVLLLASAMLWRWRWAQLMLVPGLPIHLAALALAHSRTSLGAAAVAIALLVAAYVDRRVLATIGLAGSVVLLAVAAVDPSWGWLFGGLDSTSEFLARDQRADELAAFSGREELWAVMWDSYLQAPWIGHGYFVTSSEGLLDIWGRATNFNAHNMFYQALVTTGVVGLLLFTWSQLRPFLFALLRISGADETGRRSGLFVLATVWLWTWGMLDAALLGPVTPFNIAFFVVLGLLAGMAADAGESRKPCVDGALPPASAMQGGAA